MVWKSRGLASQGAVPARALLLLDEAWKLCRSVFRQIEKEEVAWSSDWNLFRAVKSLPSEDSPLKASVKSRQIRNFLGCAYHLDPLDPTRVPTLQSPWTAEALHSPGIYSRERISVPKETKPRRESTFETLRVKHSVKSPPTLECSVDEIIKAFSAGVTTLCSFMGEFFEKQSKQKNFS